MFYHQTPILEVLIRRHLLKDRVEFLFSENASNIEAFLLHVYSNKRFVLTEKLTKHIPLLIKYGMVSRTPKPIVNTQGSLLFVNALNFELTYSCNRKCLHCFQFNSSRTQSDEIQTNQVTDIIYQAYIAGLCTRGINFTGGEVLGNRNDLLEILEYVSFLGIPFRINTNSWWTRKTNFKICNIFFPSSEELVAFLKLKGLYMFAFSFDARYDPDISLAKDLLHAIKLCEKYEIRYELIFTGINNLKVRYYLNQIGTILGKTLKFIIAGTNEVVDIGGATNIEDSHYAEQTNKCPCNNKGFYRPQIIHINPYGDMRTCLYANGLSNLGKLKQDTFANLVNRFPYSWKNKHFFNQKNLNVFCEEYVYPYLYVYKQIKHGCTTNVIISKTVESVFNNKEPKLKNIHVEIARELNLLA